MQTNVFNKVIILLFFLFYSFFIPSITFAAEPPNHLGIILLHGKTGHPHIFDNGVIGPLQQAGFLVDTPEMPWSHNRYIDKTYENTLSEIDQSITRLKNQGATKIIIAGHSMGANGAMAYAAYRGSIDGVILLAPGHTPDFSNSQVRFAADVANAKAMIDAGNGNSYANFNDVNLEKNFIRNMKASIYYSYFNPDGMAAMAKSATMLPSTLPVLYIAGSNDPQTKRLGKSYLYDKLPANPLTKYIMVNADHLGTPTAAVGEMITWLQSLEK